MCNGEKLIKSLEEMTSNFSVKLMDISYKTTAQYNSMHNLKYSYNHTENPFIITQYTGPLFYRLFFKCFTVDKPCGLVIKKIT